MQSIDVSLSNHQYPILIGENLLSETQLLQPFIKGQQVLIVSDQHVAKHYLSLLEKQCQSYQVDTVILPAGEQHKTLANFSVIIDRLIERQHHRDTTLIALGGGVVGDMTGFAAASYQRGVNVIQIPTSLLAQVDAAIGGKTGVNHAQGKNMIGAFHQPQAVIIDINTLHTLAPREFIAGLAEVIKYGLIIDADFFAWLEQHMDDLLALDTSALQYAIAKSCQAKATIVEQDEKEHGQRALLNFGHTFGHAIETATGYQQFLHGEAVAIGMALAANLSQQVTGLPTDQVTRIQKILQQAQLPNTLPQTINYETLQQALRVDKKVKNGQLRFILLNAIGQALVKEVEEHHVKWR